MDNVTLILALAACIGAVGFSLQRWPRKKHTGYTISWHETESDSNLTKVPAEVAMCVVSLKSDSAYQVSTLETVTEPEDYSDYRDKTMTAELAQKFQLTPA